MTAASSYAQVCREPGTNNPPPKDRSWINCDMRYRDMLVTCDDNNTDPAGQPNYGTRPSCPPKPMPMLDTPNRSYIENYSPYLWANARKADDPSLLYNGTFRVGTKGGPENVYNILGNSDGANALAQCIDQIRVPKEPKDLKELAQLNRLQIDNCTNQYILQAAPYPFQDSRARLINDPTHSSLPISLETECQPLSINPNLLYDNEYNASDYLKAAWIKTLNDPKYRKSKSLLELPAIVTFILNKAGLQIPNILANTAEPRLPGGLKLANTDKLKLPEPFPDVWPSMIAATPYEKIFDPTHPFSPRWDFPFNEREFYSPMTATYMKQTKNAVYCAGVREAKGESDPKKKADLEVKVDVLKFREKKFTEGMLHRIGYNTICKIDDGKIDFGAGDWLSLHATSYCVSPHLVNTALCAAIGINCGKTGNRIPCWKCFRLDGKVGDTEKKTDRPPCTTRYDGKDKGMRALHGIRPVTPGALNAFSYQATCNPNPSPLRNGKVIMPFSRNPAHAISKLCNDLRRPYTQINRLKMRYHNKDDKENIVLKNGPGEGMEFKDYFGNHMPYPRLWDEGGSLQTSNVDMNYQAPMDTTGQYTAIVGVGREGAPDSAGPDAVKAHKEERCTLGGWGTISAGGVPSGVYTPKQFLGLEAFNTPDPITSWTEMKLYQTRTMRLVNLTCLGRYEKVFKPGSTEGLIMAVTGGEWPEVRVQKCPRDKTSTVPCTFPTLKEWKDAGSPQTDKDYLYTPQMITRSIPNSWRGYITTGTTTVAGGNPLSLDPKQFPNFGATGGVSGGVFQTSDLDNAQLGDVIMMPRGATKLGKEPGLAKLAIVADVNLPKKVKKPGEKDCVDRNDCYVDVLEADNGKWPDVCGTTDSFGELKSRRYYRPGMIPSNVTVEIQGYDRSEPSKKIPPQVAPIGGSEWTVSCEDSKISPCEFIPWDSVRLYRIRNDIRPGCNKATAKECAP